MSTQKKLTSDVDEQFRAIDLMLKELKRAEKKFPLFPIDIIHRAAIIQEEAGELIQACLDYTYTADTIEHIKEEAVQIGAMSMRFLIALEKMEEGQNGIK